MPKRILSFFTTLGRPLEKVTALGLDGTERSYYRRAPFAPGSAETFLTLAIHDIGLTAEKEGATAAVTKAIVTGLYAAKYSPAWYSYSYRQAMSKCILAHVHKVDNPYFAISGANKAAIFAAGNPALAAKAAQEMKKVIALRRPMLRQLVAARLGPGQGPASGPL